MACESKVVVLQRIHSASRPCDIVRTKSGGTTLLLRRYTYAATSTAHPDHRPSEMSCGVRSQRTAGLTAFTEQTAMISATLDGLTSPWAFRFPCVERSVESLANLSRSRQGWHGHFRRTAVQSQVAPLCKQC